MVFSFTATPDFDFLSEFAALVNGPVSNGLLQIPDQLGKGFVSKHRFGPDFKVVIHRYVLNEDLTIHRKSPGAQSDLVTIFFYNNESPIQISYNNDDAVMISQRDNSAIQFTSNDLNSSVNFPAHHLVNYIVVGIRASTLKTLLSLPSSNSVIDTITTSGSSFLFYESMQPDIKNLLRQIANINFDDLLSSFQLHIKVQELLYLIFSKLMLRESAGHHSLNSDDAARLLLVRDEILRDLSVPPVIRNLAQLAAMSDTKLKLLFKQTFGTTIYTYFQRARMEEAALLLKNGNRSVAEVGYELGFSNLSHFSRLFEKHFGLRPKRFSLS